jgi:hypothetical protein
VKLMLRSPLLADQNDHLGSSTDKTHDECRRRGARLDV